MKKAGLINLICSLIAVTVAIIAVILTMIFTDVINAEPEELVISSASAMATYNGDALTDDSWRLLEGELKEGHRLSVNVTGSQTNVGISENYVSATVLDEDGVDVSEMYKIEYRPGALNVKARVITVEAASDMKAYDGFPLVADRYTIESAISLLPEHEISVTVSGSITEIGEADNKITEVYITNKLGEDVTRNYSVRTVKGKLVVYAHDSLVIESESETRAYNGQPLTNTNWRLLSGEVLADHRLVVLVTGSRTEVGTSKNTISATVLNAEGEDVSSLYSIVCKPGALTVIKQRVAITSNNASKAYDGTPLTCYEYEISPSSAQSANAVFLVNITGRQTEVGVSENTIESCTVLNAQKEDVTKNYEITFVNGTLTVVEAAGELRPTVVFMSYDGEKVYDGEPLTNLNWRIFSGGLEEGHTAEVEVTGTQTDVGKGDNTMNIVIRDGSGEDITALYNVQKELGALEVKPLEVTVTAGSAQKVYDGQPLTSAEFRVTPEHVLEKFRFEVDIVGSQTDPGESPNTVTAYKIFNADGSDVTANFKVTKADGSLKVVFKDDDLKGELYYRSGSDSKVYDGLPLTCNECKREAGELFPGHREEIIITAVLTEVGKISNAFTVNIYDENDVLVNDQYNILCEAGTLEILPIELKITAGSAKKVYDGSPLTDNTYTLEPPDALLEGHELTVEITGSRTEVGDAENVITYWRITDSGENDLSKMYKVTLEKGTLTVIPEPTDDNEHFPVFKITGSVDGPVYLKLSSFGSYDKSSNTWGAAPEYYDTISTGSSVFFIPSYALAVAGNTVNSCYIKPLVGIFALPYYAVGELTVGYGDYTIVGDGSREYTAEYVSFDKMPSASDIPAELYEKELSYRSFVYENYLDVDSETYAFMEGVIEKEGLSASDPEIIQKVAAYISGAAEYNLDYDVSLDLQDNVIIAFLTTHPEGVCRHYAAAATLLYRTLGIPARYTQGFYADLVADEEVTVTTETAHAWVEVYVDGLGWTYVEVTGSGGSSGGPPGGGGTPGGGVPLTDPNSGSMIMGPGEDELKNPVDVFTVTNGVDDVIYLKQQSYGNYDGINSWGVPTVYGSNLPGGEAAFFLPAYALDNSGRVTTNCYIKPLAGVFALPYHTQGKFAQDSTDTAILGSGTSAYTVSYYNWDNYAGARLPSAYRDAEAAYSQFVKENYLDVDAATLAYMQEVIAEQGFSASDADVINKVAKYIKKSARYNLEYDRRLDAAENVVVAFLSEFREGICQHYASAATLLFRALGIPARYTVGYASPVKMGTATTITTAKAHAWVEVYVDGIGWLVVEVTGNGNAATGSDQPVKLEVKPTYTGAVYNGQPLTAKQTVDGLASLVADGYTYEATIEGTNTELGIIASTVTGLKIYDSFNVLVYDKESGLGADKFIVTYKQGQVQLYLSNLVFKSESYSKEYDGIALEITESDCYMTSGTVYDGYTYTITNLASITKAGEKVASYTVTVYKDGVVCNDHYRITRNYGTLTVTPKEITITAGSDTKPHDGRELVCNEIIYDENALASGDTVAAYTVSGSQTNIGKCSNVIKTIIIKNKNGDDVTDSYVIKTVDGLLTVTMP